MEATSKQPLIWTDNFGKDHVVKDMATKHIVNCVKMIHPIKDTDPEASMYYKIFTDILRERNKERRKQIKLRKNT